MYRFLAALALAVPFTLGFVLDGSPTSYAQFKKWNVGLNGSLEFEFKTEQANGLLLYTDDGGTYDFFEIKLVEGALRLRYNLGGGAQILTVGHDLNDGHWHKVQVQRKVERTTLSVDGASQTRTSRGKEFFFGHLSTNSDVYVGGMPAWYNTKLTLLALPSVIFELRFKGAIRNLVYADEHSRSPRRQEMKMKSYKCTGRQCRGSKGKSKGSHSNATDACEDMDPCQHGGICISTDNGPICECRNVDYEGPYCEKDKAPSEATFRGSEYLSYDLNRTGGEPIVSSQDIISLIFKTRFQNGLLFYTGDGQDYLNLALKDGGIIIVMSMGNGKLEMTIRPNRVRFDDNQWHKVTVHRKVQEISSITSFCRISANVDGIYSDHSHLHGPFSMLSSSKVYVGGSQTTHSLPGSKIHNNFVGCLRKVEFSADTLKLNLLDLGKTGNKLLTVAGNIDFKCHELSAADAVTFLTGKGYLVLPNWEAGRTGTLAFKIRTNEPDGLLIYSKGPSSSPGDFFGFEMLDGHVFLHIDLGSGPLKIKVTTRRIDDGAWHETSLRRNGREGRVSVDGMIADFTTPGESNLLDLDGGLYVGGVGPPLTYMKVPIYFWTGVMRKGYVGCMRDLVINGNAVDLAGYSRQQDSTSIRPSCHVQPGQCDSQPCMNGGACSEGWNRYICDCTATSFTGPICGKEAATMTFNGTQYMGIGLPEETRTQTEDVVLRFRTTRHAGLIFTTNDDYYGDKLELTVAGSKLRFHMRIGGLDEIITMGQGLNDNQWHHVKFSRRAPFLRLELDKDPPVRIEKDFGQDNILTYKTIYLGGHPATPNEAIQPVEAPSLIGAIQQFSFNGEPYLERSNLPYKTTLAKLYPNIQLTARYVKREHSLIFHPITIKSKHTFVGLPALKAYSTTNIFFQFKTRETHGIILYNGGKDRDFIAVELFNGHIYYIFNLGDGPVRLKDNSKTPLNDNRWHTVKIDRPNVRQHTLTVDDNFAIITNLGHNEMLDLSGILYLGGVRKDIYQVLPKQVQSRQGFQGCLASFNLNGESPNTMLEAVIPSTQVVSGCEGIGVKCSNNICANKGICVQQWNSYVCDCEATSYTGPTCSDESVSYEFGPNGGMITFLYPEEERPEMKADTMTLGFATSKEDCVILRVDSGTSNDYMELQLIEGNIFMLYNMGTNDHPIGEINVKVNDDAYHVMRFTRSGPNTTMQIDDYTIQTNYPPGHQLSVFNSQAQVQIGGKWNRAKSRIDRAFVGVISGLVFNGLRILDLAAENDPRIMTRGDVQLMTGIRNRVYESFQRMQQTPASNFPGIMDDLVYSGAGSGCQNDDEDQCQPVFDTGSGDDLITPVYVPPTRQPSTSRPPSRGSNQSNKPCDDEDCFVSSGNGEITTEDTSTGPSRGSSTTGSTTPEGNQRGSSTVITASEVPDLTSPEVTSRGSSSSSSTSSSSISTSRTTTTVTSTSIKTTVGMITTSTTTSTELPDIFQPLPPRSTHRTPDSKKRDRISSEAAENTALVIGIIAGTMIAIILIILIILRFKHRSVASYKIDESKSYQKAQGANAALLPAASSGQFHQNGNLRNGNGNGNGNGRGMKKPKDVKEWYV